MKRHSIAALCAAFVGALALQAAAQADQEALKKKKEKKLASAFLKNGDWHTDFDEAKKSAQESGKIIFTYFTRSYAP